MDNTDKLDKLEHERLKRILVGCIDNLDLLSGWEIKFVRDLILLEESLGLFMRVSLDQWEVLFKLQDKVAPHVR